MTANLSPEQKARELLESTPHAADCKIARTPKGVLAKCTCNRAVRAIISSRTIAIEECAVVADEMPARILYFYDRPGSPPGNQFRPTTRADVAAAIRALNTPSPASAAPQGCAHPQQHPESTHD